MTDIRTDELCSSPKNEVVDTATLTERAKDLVSTLTELGKFAEQEPRKVIECSSAAISSWAECFTAALSSLETRLEEARGSFVNSDGVRCRPSQLGQTSTTPEAFRDVLLNMARSAPAAVPVPDTQPDNQDLGGKQSLPCGGGS